MELTDGFIASALAWVLFIVILMLLFVVAIQRKDVVRVAVIVLLFGVMAWAAAGIYTSLLLNQDLEVALENFAQARQGVIVGRGLATLFMLIALVWLTRDVRPTRWVVDLVDRWVDKIISKYSLV